MTLRPLITASLIACIPCAALAAVPLALYPEHIGAETARYDHGKPTVSLQVPGGRVEIRPLPVDDGKVAFSIAVFNEGQRAVNFGPENIVATLDGVPIAIPTHDQLARQAQEKARAAKIGTALFAGVLAGVASTASSQGTTYRGVSGPHGTYVRAIHWEDDTPGVIGATAAVAGGAMVIKGIDRKMDYTLDQLGSQILQTTTVDPGSTFGGMIVLPGAAQAKGAGQLRLSVRFSGANYPFAFRLMAQGGQPPAPLPATQVEMTPP